MCPGLALFELSCFLPDLLRCSKPLNDFLFGFSSSLFFLCGMLNDHQLFLFLGSSLSNFFGGGGGGRRLSGGPESDLLLAGGPRLIGGPASDLLLVG